MQVIDSFADQPILSISHLTKTYSGGHKAVDDVSIDIMPGDIYGFIGHNGAGKTSTIKCAVGIQSFDSGDIRILGKDIKKEPIECKKMFSYIPDNPELFDQLTGIQYLNFISDIFALSTDKRNASFAKYADFFSISDKLGDLISSYSHGMKQKLAIIASLIHDPMLFILDEPFVGLDPEASFKFKELMRDFVKEGKAIFFSTHVLDTAEKLCNKIALIDEGRLLANGSIDEVTKGRELEDVFMELVRK